jgi:hypothetical protein
MKPLILMLLVATYAAAQKPTIADVARQERARRGQSNSTKVYTTADIKTPAPKGTEPTPTASPAPPIAPAVTSTATAAPAPAATMPTPAIATPVPAIVGPDPVQQWTIDTEKLRTQIRELIDQEAVAQLDINIIMNKVNAPVTSVGERDRAFKDLEVAQNKLTATRDQLLRKRSELQARELQGPPRK